MPTIADMFRFFGVRLALSILPSWLSTVGNSALPPFFCVPPPTTKTGSPRFPWPHISANSAQVSIPLRITFKGIWMKATGCYWMSCSAATFWFHERKQRKPRASNNFLWPLFIQHLQRYCKHLNPYIKPFSTYMPKIVAIFLTKPSLRHPHTACHYCSQADILSYVHLSS